MAETLGLAGSVIAIIGLTAKVVVLGYRFHEYARDMKRAPMDIQKLMNELHSLMPVLVALRDFALANQQSTTLQMLDVPNGPLQDCAQELRYLEERLKPKKGWKGKTEILMWPLQEQETTRHISLLERHKTLFALALNMDHISLSKAIEGYAHKTWDVVQNIEMCVQDTFSAFQGINESVQQTNQIVQDIQHRTVTRDSLNQGHISRISEEDRVAILNWLYPDDFNRTHVEISTRRQKNTGEWLLKRPGFQDWSSGRSSSRLIWGSGIPGAGKTFLSSVVIDHFQTREQTTKHGVAYIYFNYKEQEEQKPSQVLASLVKQLSGQMSHLPAGITGLYSRLRLGGKRPTIDELYIALLEVSKSFPKVFLIFDALDECHPENQRRFLLPIFLQMGRDGISVFLTSRPHPEDIQDLLKDTVKIELSAQDGDIEAYIVARIDENPRARGLVRQGRCKERIISELIDSAKGMFLLVRFHVEFLCQQTSPRQILAALDMLKSSSTGKRPLDPTYRRAIQNIKAQDKSSTDLAFTILSWLVKAKRTLTVEELQIAVAIEQYRYELDDMDLADRATLLDVCASLVVIDESSDIATIKLAHYTVQEYLVENHILPADADFQLAMSCITYLSFDSFAEGPCASLESLQARLELHPFLEYVAKNIGFHLQSCDDECTIEALLKFLGNLDSIYSYYQAESYMHEHPKYSWDWYARGILPLHIASALGNLAVVRVLLEGGPESQVSAMDGGGMTPLHWAAMSGNEAVVSLLLEKGADVLAVSKGYDAPLREEGSESIGYQTVVSLLLDKGADISVVNKDGRTLLHCAALQGNEAVVSLLLEKGANIRVSAIDKDGQTPLHYAAMQGNGAVITLLLEKGALADISAVGKKGRTPLYYAAMQGTEEVVSLLLDNGANISATDISGWTPLHVAADNGHQAVVGLLLGKGADISAVDRGGLTPLHVAASGKSRHTVAVPRLLLKQGADTSAVDNNGSTPLHLAVSGMPRPNLEMVSLLLEQGADISAVDNNGSTPLYLATSGRSNYSSAVVGLLIEKGAEITAAVNAGFIASHYVRFQRHGVVGNLLPPLSPSQVPPFQNT